MAESKHEKGKEKQRLQTGYFEEGLTYGRMGDTPDILVDIDALSFTHEPPQNMFSKSMFISTARLFAKEYTYYLVGRKPNVPEDYSFTDMATDYATMIRREFKKPVDVMGISTGGQIAQYLAADHPDVVRKLVILSAAYRLSEKGLEMERKSEEYFKQEKYGESVATIMDIVFGTTTGKSVPKSSAQMFGKNPIGKVKYPNDFLTEIRADREMDFKDRLNEIKAPTLVMSGELDIAFAADDVRATAEGIPNAELIIYEGYGHNVTVANKRQVVKDILEFLKK